MKEVTLSYCLTDDGHSVRRTCIAERGTLVLSRTDLPRHKTAGLAPESAFDYSYLRRAHPWVARGGDRIRAVDLFCGAGGLSLGAREACLALGKSFLPLLAADRDPDCVDVYNSNFGFAAMHCDITQVLNGRIGEVPTAMEKNALKPLKGVDLLLAGPPCQGNSDLNNHTRRDDKRNSLYLSVARFVEIAKPKSVLIENIPMVVHGKEQALSRTLEVLESLDYHVDTHVFDLAKIGVPQRRRRHVVVASKKSFPALADIAEQQAITEERTAWWAIDDLESKQEGGILGKPTKYSEENIKRISYLHREDLYDLPDFLRPPCHRNGNHSYKSMYGRMYKSQPCQTITSGFSSPGQGRFVHPTLPRTITAQEAARLQFLPDFFHFDQARTKKSLSNMIGNAAPMKLAFVIGLAILA